MGLGRVEDASHPRLLSLRTYCPRPRPCRSATSASRKAMRNCQTGGGMRSPCHRTREPGGSEGRDVLGLDSARAGGGGTVLLDVDVRAVLVSPWGQ